MSHLDETTEIAPAGARAQTRAPGERLALIVVWSAEAPHRLGEAILVAPRGAPIDFGRGSTVLVRQRPEENRPTPPLRGRRISRAQLRIQGMGARIQIENVGRCPLIVHGTQTTQAVVKPGDLVHLEGQLTFLVARRPAVLPPSRAVFVPPWGGADEGGIVGESPSIWQLRDQLGFIAPRVGHVLILGRSGTGKELAAQAVHAASGRAKQPFIARNAATIPDSLLDAELFGHVQNYPNPGMPARAGLVGEADGGTLFLDEIGELPQSMQVHLLRLMDAGEYQRLGEPRQRTADLRIVAATNRSRDALKPDVLARFRHVIELPDLDARREDLPLLLRHLLRRAAAEDADIARFVVEDEPQVSPAFVAALIGHPLPMQVRSIDALLWQALAASQGTIVERPASLELPSTPDAEIDPSALSIDEVRDALAEAEGVQEKAWRALGLQSRYQLRRLIRKFDL